ncbi:hypothetical protein GJ496_000035 [Pomphorhynchus laevis]|nr:hypothetical protein GJ496_000035 [Pomphorhynchus laevis]
MLNLHAIICLILICNAYLDYNPETKETKFSIVTSLSFKDDDLSKNSGYLCREHSYYFTPELYLTAIESVSMNDGNGIDEFNLIMCQNYKSNNDNWRSQLYQCNAAYQDNPETAHRICGNEEYNVLYSIAGSSYHLYRMPEDAAISITGPLRFVTQIHYKCHRRPHVYGIKLKLHFTTRIPKTFLKTISIVSNDAVDVDVLDNGRKQSKLCWFKGDQTIIRPVLFRLIAVGYYRAQLIIHHRNNNETEKFNIKASQDYHPPTSSIIKLSDGDELYMLCYSNKTNMLDKEHHMHSKCNFYMLYETTENKESDLSHNIIC